MKLHAKLLLAQTPLVLALVAIVIVGGFIARSLGRSAQRILEDNYRSVLSVQHMKDALERIHNETPRLADGDAQMQERARAQTVRFESELRAQEANITEKGEKEATARLRRAWMEYERSPGRMPAYEAVRDAADTILAMNQDAMVRKSEEARRVAERSSTILIAVSVMGLLLGLLASTTLTGRILRPLSVLGQAAQALGDGDLAARARVEGRDEIARLANEFNTMADRIQKYRQSSLGELLEAQRASQAAIDSLPDPVLVVGTEGSLLHVNRAAETLLGVRLEAGREGLARMEPALRAAVERARRHVASGKGAFNPRGTEGDEDAVRVSTPEGDKRYLPRAAPVYAEEGAVAGTTIVLQDVTRLLRFDELRNDLVATVAHEFRTPLTSLRLAIHVLTEQLVGPLTDKQAELVYAAREDCERLQAIIDELLDLSRMQGGRIALRTVSVEAEDLVRTALEAGRPAAAARQIRLVSEVLPGAGRVRADPDRIQIVFANLLTNAVRHAPPGSDVTVRTASVAGSPGRVRFEVVDRGPGISPEQASSIFEKYVQAAGGSPGGAGLGLYIAREIVQAHGGAIGVESEPGRGSTFWFELDVAQAVTADSRA